MFGPRLKLMAKEDGSSFRLLLDEYDEATGESKIAVIECPRAQLQEWSAAFAKALDGRN